MKLTDVQRRTLVALSHGPLGPASLSNHVWPGHVALRKGMAPGTGLVRPMLAVLARLRKVELVEWFSPLDDAPAVWTLTLRGMDAIEIPQKQRVALLTQRHL